MKPCFFLLFSCCFFIAGPGNAQIKFEKEYRLKPVQVPERAHKFIDALGFKNKIKWYREEGLNKRSIEAKTKHHSKKYSIEFDTLGIVEDVEIEILWNDIQIATRKKITRYLDSTYTKYKTVKIQIQYSGNDQALIDLLTKQETVLNHTINFEIVLRGKSGKRSRLFEYLFSEKGDMLKRSNIIFRNTDNLEY